MTVHRADNASDARVRTGPSEDPSGPGGTRRPDPGSTATVALVTVPPAARRRVIQRISALAGNRAVQQAMAALQRETPQEVIDRYTPTCVG